MIQAIVILLALVLGYFINIRRLSNRMINRILSLIVSLIIFVMGYNFGKIALGLNHEFFTLAATALSFMIALVIVNLIAVRMLVILKPERQLKSINTQTTKPNALKPFLQSCQYLLYLVIGIVLGILLDVTLDHISLIIDALLVITLFMIGTQMRREGHSLTQVLKNKTGIMIACVIIISSLVTGAVVGFMFKIPLSNSLMLTSGFGWYSLSSILNAELIDAHFGTLTFFIDFSREIFAFLLIPTLGDKFGLELVAYSGATAMDFTLPVIKDHIGIHAVPIAISSGFVLTIVTPVLIPLIHLFA